MILQCSTLTLVHQARISKTSWWAGENALLQAPRLVSDMKNNYYNFIIGKFCFAANVSQDLKFLIA